MGDSGNYNKVDSSFLMSYKKDLDEIFRVYIEDINPFIVQFEVIKGEFPIEIQNEIRAIFGHLARASIADSPYVAERNIQKIKSHTKRALLDCYKYSCVIFSDKYSSFFERYKGTDLSYLKKGKFLSEIHKIYNEAKMCYYEAKTAEISNVSEDEQFEMHQNAYNKFVKLNNMLEDAEEEASFLKHKATKKEILAIISFIIAVISTLVTIISFFA